MVSLFWLRRVSSIALRTTAVCCTLCSFGDERILSSLSLRDIGASTAILLYFRDESLYQTARLDSGPVWVGIFLKADRERNHPAITEERAKNRAALMPRAELSFSVLLTRSPSFPPSSLCLLQYASCT